MSSKNPSNYSTKPKVLDEKNEVNNFVLYAVAIVIILNIILIYLVYSGSLQSAQVSSMNYLSDSLNKVNDLDPDFKTYMIVACTFIILIIFIGYAIYLSRLEAREVSYMNGLYPSVNGNLRAINSSDPDCKGKLYDYYIKTAYNACSGGSYKNDFVSIDVLKTVIKQGVRCLDFEIYSIDNQPVVSTSTTDSYYVKETFNSVKFSDVMDTIANYAFSGGTCPNPTDPLFIHLRIKSNNQKMYTNLAKIFKSHINLMLGMDYSFEDSGKNLGRIPLLELQNKIGLIIDRSNSAFLENEDLLEFVNLTSNSIFMRAYDYYSIKNNADINELIEYNKTGMTIVFPDNGSNPANPSGVDSRDSGCQMVAMRYQLNDSNLKENNLFFDNAGYAFAIKPDKLR
jgi:hypothetical protein